MIKNGNRDFCLIKEHVLSAKMYARHGLATSVPADGNQVCLLSSESEAGDALSILQDCGGGSRGNMFMKLSSIGELPAEDFDVSGGVRLIDGFIKPLP